MKSVIERFEFFAFSLIILYCSYVTRKAIDCGFFLIPFHLFLLISFVIILSISATDFPKWARASARFRAALAVRLRMAAVASATAYSQALC
jgi:hypothetical protein